jgi:hypothetical protein
LKQEPLNLIVKLHILVLAEEWSQVSDDAKNLIKRMLTYDPERRISS